MPINSASHAEAPDQNAISSASGDSLAAGLLSSIAAVGTSDGMLLGTSSSGPEQSLPALECLVKFLGVWTTKFPYDFRDERIMSHVKHIVAK